MQRDLQAPDIMVVPVSSRAPRPFSTGAATQQLGRSALPCPSRARQGGMVLSSSPAFSSRASGQPLPSLPLLDQ